MDPHIDSTTESIVDDAEQSHMTETSSGHGAEAGAADHRVLGVSYDSEVFFSSDGDDSDDQGIAETKYYPNSSDEDSVIGPDHSVPGRVITTKTEHPAKKISWGPEDAVQMTGRARKIAYDMIRHAVEKAELETCATVPDAAKGKEREVSNMPGSNVASPSVRAVDHLIQAVDQFDLRAPPSTPPDTIFHAQLSTPTLVNLHPMADPELTTHFRTERAKDPKGFDGRTRLLKERQIKSKVERGGIPKLLKNEYTVELASRIDAAKTDRMAQVKAGKLSSSGVAAAAAAPPPAAEMKLPPPSAFVTDPNFNLSDHVNKAIVGASFRAQNVETCVSNDESTTRTLKLSIEITMTHKVAKDQEWTWKEVCKAVEERDENGKEKRKEIKDEDDQHHSSSTAAVARDELSLSRLQDLSNEAIAEAVTNLPYW